MLSMVEFNNIIMPNEYPNRDSTLKDRLRPQENTEVGKLEVSLPKSNSFNLYFTFTEHNGNGCKSAK